MQVSSMDPLMDLRAPGLHGREDHLKGTSEKKPSITYTSPKPCTILDQVTGQGSLEQPSWRRLLM